MSIQKLKEINDAIKRVNVASIWKEATNYKVVLLKKDLTTELLLGNDLLGLGEAHGIYRWYILDFTLYIGKADLRPVAARTNSHLSSYRNPNNKNEMSGKKLRKLMYDNNLNELIVFIDYVKLDDAMESIGWFENSSIDHFKPILNFQVKTA